MAKLIGLQETRRVKLKEVWRGDCPTHNRFCGVYLLHLLLSTVLCALLECSPEGSWIVFESLHDFCALDLKITCIILNELRNAMLLLGSQFCAAPS